MVVIIIGNYTNYLMLKKMLLTPKFKFTPLKKKNYLMAMANHFFLQFPGPELSNKSLNTINFPLNSPFKCPVCGNTLVWSFLWPQSDYCPRPSSNWAPCPVFLPLQFLPHECQINLLKVELPREALFNSGFQGAKRWDARLPL